MTLTAYLAHVAMVYASHVHEPDSVTVRQAYADLRYQLVAQYAMLCHGLTIEHTPRDPYPNTAAMFADIDRGRLSVYTHADLPENHPFAEPSGLGLTVDDIFRAVHDALAHYPGRHGFGPRGEYRAYKAHCTFLSPLAQWALATETLAQNAWYVTHGTYAPQKATLLPRELLTITPEDI